MPPPPPSVNDTSNTLRVGKTVAYPAIRVHRGLQVREHRDHPRVRLRGVSRRPEGGFDDGGRAKRTHRVSVQRQPDC